MELLLAAPPLLPPSGRADLERSPHSAPGRVGGHRRLCPPAIARRQRAFRALPRLLHRHSRRHLHRAPLQNALERPGLLARRHPPGGSRGGRAPGPAAGAAAENRRRNSIIDRRGPTRRSRPGSPPSTSSTPPIRATRGPMPKPSPTSSNSWTRWTPWRRRRPTAAACASASSRPTPIIGRCPGICAALARPATLRTCPATRNLRPGEIQDVDAFVNKVRAKSDPVSKFLLDSGLTNNLDAAHPANGDPAPFRILLVTNLNRIVTGPSIYDSNRFQQIHLRPETDELLRENPRGQDLIRLNRRLLEDAYPAELGTNNLPVEPYPPVTIISAQTRTRRGPGQSRHHDRLL